MGWYLRKSVRLGPLRLNLSKSGVGASAGVKGLRISTGPRGSYIHGGRGGVYFRQRLGGPADREKPRNSPPARLDSLSTEGVPIRTAQAARLVEADAQNLLDEINRSLKTTSLAPLVIGLGCCATGAALLASALQHWAWVFAAVPCLAATIAGGALAQARDTRLKTIHLWFEMGDDASRRFSHFELAMDALASCQRIWRVTTRLATDDWKRNAGATSLISRTPVRMTRRLPPFFESNLCPYSLGLGSQVLYFFPDHVLVYEQKRMGAVSYESLQVDAGVCSFRETNGVPDDARVIERTWRYVNKKGGPDKRFRDNPEIPVCQYGTLAFHSATGLNIHLMLSRPDISDMVREAEGQLIPL